MCSHMQTKYVPEKDGTGHQRWLRNLIEALTGEN